MKVRAGKSYLYNPVPMDLCDPKTTLKRGDLVEVVKLSGCPPPNTMGHCHVNHKGKFAGLVCCNSLMKYDMADPDVKAFLHEIAMGKYNE